MKKFNLLIAEKFWTNFNRDLYEKILLAKRECVRIDA